MRTKWFESVTLLTLAALFLGAASGSAFAADPLVIQWNLSVSTKDALPLRKGSLVTAHLHAAILKGWHLYALDQQPGGPSATRINLSSRSFTLDGDIHAPAALTAFDANFNLRTRFYEDQATFIVPLKTLSADATKVALDVTYQACSDTMCMPPTTTRLWSFVIR